MSRNPARFDHQKLRWLNGRYVRALSVDDLTARLEAFTGRSGLRAAVEISREKMQTLADFWPLAGFIFDGPADDPAAREKWLDEDGRAALRDGPRRRSRRSSRSRRTRSRPRCEGVVAALGVKPKQVFQPIRVALAGRAVSPGIFETLAVLGRDESLRAHRPRPAASDGSPCERASTCADGQRISQWLSTKRPQLPIPEMPDRSRPEGRDRHT